VAAIAQCEFCCVLTLAFIRCGAFRVMKIQIVIFWFMTQCNLVGGYHHFGRTYCLHLHGYEFWDFHGGKNSYYDLLACHCAIWHVGTNVWRNILLQHALPWRWKQHVPPKWYSHIRLHGVITKMTTIRMTLAMSSHYCISDIKFYFTIYLPILTYLFLTQIQK
jgi:hypothetical protein